MTEKDKIYIAALLHDIGKFIERGKNESWKEEAYKYVLNKQASKGYAHRRYSSIFIEKYLNDKEFISDYNPISELVLHHHNDNPSEVENYLSIDERGLLQQIVRMADDLASSERIKDESLDPDKYYLVNLESPFNDIVFKDENNNEKKIKNKQYLAPAKLGLSGNEQFPKNEKKSDNDDNLYQSTNLVEDFLNEIENIESENALLSLMEKYLSQVPAQTPTEFNGEKHLYKPDLNLYDHSRAVAAIAVTLYDEFENGAYKKLKNNIVTKNKKYIEQLSNIGNPAILICGNVNGIQDFIFDVKSSKAAKSLKGRSYFVQLVTEVISKLIIDKFGLKEANILYNGGGNFFILAPNYRKADIQEIQKFVAEKLRDTNLYLSLGVTEVSFDDFENFGDAFDRAVKASNEAKKKKFKGIEFDKVFSPFPQRLKGEGKYNKLAEALQLATNYYIGPDNKNEVNRPEWEKLFRELDYQVSLRPNVDIDKQGLVYNDLNFTSQYSSFRLAVKDLPLWTNDKLNGFENIVKTKKLSSEEFNIINDEKPNKEQPIKIISFKRLAQYAYFENGTEKLGVLKMDIDNLGKIFKDGLQKPTIGRVAFLSRSLKWFFEGYMNTLLTSNEFKDRIYPIFSGGDDFFVVGAWNKIFEFSFKVRNEFRRFVSEHPGITLSASLLVIDETFPVKQYARLAEERLEEAKNRRDIKTNKKIKDAISVFDTVLSWDDFKEAKILKSKIVKIIRLTNGNRAIIQKILNSSKGFATIQKEALFTKVIKMYKVWRLNYYLRDLVNYSKENKEEIKMLTKNIIEQYEELFFEAFKGNNTSIQIFPVAARWAELGTRNNLGDK